MNSDCPVCLEKMTNERCYGEICAHAVCYTCFDTMEKMNKKVVCPVCREPMRDDKKRKALEERLTVVHKKQTPNTIAKKKNATREKVEKTRSVKHASVKHEEFNTDFEGHTCGYFEMMVEGEMYTFFD